uniref:Uncharacterized protein n=3 Tax=Nostocales TaxID=1161 RepID=A0A0C1QUS5_9CYAN
MYDLQGNKAYVLCFVILVTSIAISFKFTNTYTGKVFNQCLMPSQISNILKFLLDLSKLLSVKYPAMDRVLLTNPAIATNSKDSPTNVLYPPK